MTRLTSLLTLPYLLLHIPLRPLARTKPTRWANLPRLVTVTLFYNETVSRIALLSVSDKNGLIDLAKGLTEAGVRLVGSGGTAKAVREAGMVIE